MAGDRLPAVFYLTVLNAMLSFRAWSASGDFGNFELVRAGGVSVITVRVLYPPRPARPACTARSQGLRNL